VNQVFVEPPPNPEWTAATGTFKAIVLKSEEVIHGVAPPPTSTNSPGANSPGAGSAGLGSTGPTSLSFSSTELSSEFGEDEFELDADFLSATAEMRKLKTGISDADDGVNNPGPLQPAPAQTQIPPSARLAPRGPLADPPSQSRSSLMDVPVQPQSRFAPVETPARQQLKAPPSQPEPDTFFEPEVISRPPARAAVKAFGLDAEPPPERLAALARSRVAPGAIELEPSPPPRPLLNYATLWSAGAGALVMLLAAQIVHHYRNDLAATAQFNKPITALYAALGVHLTPRWDLHAYDVRQLGASVDSASAGQIMVRASVKNGAHQPQPMPLLRVTLQDRFGNRIAARDVPPGSYLPRATADTAFLPAGQRIDAEMAFVDPGSNAVGFEIDACLPAPAGGIACANDPVAR
jgi:hypothetical protein